MLVVLLVPAGATANGMSYNWTPIPGDRVVVDVSQSIVYLVHTNGEFLALDGLTGQNRVVRYDGITYNASTPEREWEVRSDGLHKKGRSVTFGEGRFFRLSWPGHIDPRTGNETTAYGIHSHRTFEKMLKDKNEMTAWDRQGNGQRSMGCVLVSESDLDLVQQTWETNGKFLSVTTKKTVDPLAFENTNSLPSWLGALIN